MTEACEQHGARPLCASSAVEQPGCVKLGEKLMSDPKEQAQVLIVHISTHMHKCDF
jgi:hypothetical protein